MFSAICVAVIVAGGVYLVRTSSRGQSPRGDSSPLPAVEIPLPEIDVVTGADGTRMARFSQEKLAASCRSLSLPEPPDLQGADPVVVRALVEALGRIIREPDAANYGRLGQIFSSLSCYGMAERCFEIAASLAPEDYRWAYYLGTVAQAVGRGDEAVTYFERVLSLNPRYPLTHARLGHLAMEAGNVDAAEVHFRSYVDLAPGDGFGHVGLGRVALSRDDPEAGLEHLLEAVRLVPQDFQSHYYLARAYAALGREEEAKKHFDVSSRLPRGAIWTVRDPLEVAVLKEARSIEYLEYEFQRRMDSDDWETLTRLAEQIISRRPRNYVMMRNLASLYRKKKRFDEALRLAERALQIKPDSPMLRTTLAETRLSQGEYERALQHAQKALDLDDGYAQAHAVRGRAFVHLERYANAEPEMRRAVELAPSDASHVYVLAEILRVTGRPNEAAEFYARTLELQPSHTLARKRLREHVSGSRAPRPPNDRGDTTTK